MSRRGAVEGLPERQRRGCVLPILLGEGSRGLEGAGEREPIDLERGRDLSRDQVERGLLEGPGVVGIEEADRKRLPDPMRPSVRLARHARVIVGALVPERGCEGRKVVEAGLDGLGVDEEDAAAASDRLVEPRLTLPSRDLRGIEEGGLLAELLEEEPVARRRKLSGK